MRGPEEWPSHGSNPADRIRLTGPAATSFFFPLPGNDTSVLMYFPQYRHVRFIDFTLHRTYHGRAVHLRSV
jgi:hypothetical protein